MFKTRLEQLGVLVYIVWLLPKLIWAVNWADMSGTCRLSGYHNNTNAQILTLLLHDFFIIVQTLGCDIIVATILIILLVFW